MDVLMQHDEAMDRLFIRDLNLPLWHGERCRLMLSRALVVRQEGVVTAS